jgi:DNA-directed RNA polymerase subunit RPC12/RpoP
MINDETGEMEPEVMICMMCGHIDGEEFFERFDEDGEPSPNACPECGSLDVSIYYPPEDPTRA